MYKPQARYMQDVKLDRYRTYALLFKESKSTDTSAFQQAIGKEIIYQMGLRGYTETMYKPDVAIQFELLNQVVRLPEFESSYILKNPGDILYLSKGHHISVKGTLIIRIYELKSKDLIFSTYIDHLNRFGSWNESLLRIKTKNLLIKYPFRKEKG